VATGSPTISGTTKLFYKISGTGGDLRVLQVGIDGINLSYAGGALSLTIPTTAVLYLYAVRSDGVTTASASFTNALQQALSITGGSAFSMNVQSVMNNVQSQFSSPFLNIFSSGSTVGTFNAQFTISSNVALTQADGTALSNSTDSVTGTAFSVTGPSLTGKLRFQ